MKKCVLVMLSLAYMALSVNSYATDYYDKSVNSPKEYLYSAYAKGTYNHGTPYTLGAFFNKDGDLLDVHYRVVKCIPFDDSICVPKKDFVLDKNVKPVEYPRFYPNFSERTDKNTGYKYRITSDIYNHLETMQLNIVNSDDSPDIYRITTRINSTADFYKISSLRFILDDGRIINIPTFSLDGKYFYQKIAVGKYHISLSTFATTTEFMKIIADHAIRYEISTPHNYAFDITRANRGNFKYIVNPVLHY